MAAAAPRARVFGLLVVRDAADLIRVNLLHHLGLGLGLERMLVLDNGSHDGTADRVRRLARTLPIELDVDGGPFDHGALVNRLAARAWEAGADWVLPIDADEFFVAAEPLPDLLGRSRAGALRVGVVNFVQRNRRRKPSERGLLTMDHRPAHTIPQAEARYHLATGEWSMVEVAWQPKVVVRAGERVGITVGNHDVVGATGPVEATDRIVCLHAPLRDRSQLESRLEHGRRHEAAGAASDVGWQNQDLRRTVDVTGLWRANSNRRGTLEVGGEPRALVPDPRLREVCAPYVPGRLAAAVARVRGS
jgi:hypothetical protein